MRCGHNFINLVCTWVRGCVSPTGTRQRLPRNVHLRSFSGPIPDRQHVLNYLGEWWVLVRFRLLIFFSLRIRRNIRQLAISIFSGEAVLLGTGHETCSEVEDSFVLCHQRTASANPRRPLSSTHGAGERDPGCQPPALPTGIPTLYHH